MKRLRRSEIYVFAGVNGAGKSSIGGARFQFGTGYFNPDTFTRDLRTKKPHLSEAEANGLAWRTGVEMLRRAIEERTDFAFETTLGGNTIRDLLVQAAAKGIDVHIWYAGLSSPELHIKRVSARVRHGGHHISDADIRRRYETSQLNLVELMPRLASLRVYDNSAEADPYEGKTPAPMLVLHVKHGKILNRRDLPKTPQWAKHLVAAAMKLHLSLKKGKK